MSVAVCLDDRFAEPTLATLVTIYNIVKITNTSFGKLNRKLNQNLDLTGK
jgi:hypothetical protein